MRRFTTLLVLVGMISVVAGVPAAAQSANAHVSDPIVEGLAGPLGLAIGGDGTVYVSQTFAGLLSAVVDGEAAPIAFSPSPYASIAGVAAQGVDTVVFTVTGFNEETGRYIGLVQGMHPSGGAKTFGNPGRYEERVNPDRINTYGFRGLDPACADLVPEFIGGYPYTGVVDSNSYAVEFIPGGVAVADAGGNSIVRVDRRSGRVSTLAVLPPLPGVITAEAAALFGLPDCAIGATYDFEPVPTDVELGPDGMLYVSALPGGPEDDSLGARGRVFRVDPANGAVVEVASGFLGAVDLAVAPDGTIYVAELFGNRISKVVGGAPYLVAEVNEPGAIEWAHGVLYATINAFGNGSVVTITP